MFLSKTCLWLKLIILLAILCVIVGCTSQIPQATTSGVASPSGEAQPESTIAGPIITPRLMITPQELEPNATENPSSSEPNPISESINMPAH